MPRTSDIDILHDLPMVADLPAWQADALVKHVEHLKLKKGAILIEQGTDDGFTYFLTAGKVSLECGGNEPMVVEAGTESLGRPLANLRPRIVDVKAMERIRAVRIPDILLSAVDCGGAESGAEQAADDASSHDDGPHFRRELPFRLYADLNDDEASILPSLPDTAVRIQLAIEDERSDADTVARLVMTDPAIATKLIKTANSALYGGRSPVETPSAAVVRLGMQTTRQLVLSFALKEVFRSRNQVLRQRMKDLWEHSTNIAALCFVLAREFGNLNPEEALLIGLVHDVGTIPIINYASDGAHPNADGLEQAIACLRGELGALILRRWRFAPAVVVAARDAENWMRRHDAPTDFADLLIVAQIHERMRTQDTADLPRLEDIPAFMKVLGEDVSPDKSLAILRQASHTSEQMRSVLRR